MKYRHTTILIRRPNVVRRSPSGRLSGPKAGRLRGGLGNSGLPAPGLRVVPASPGGRSAHSLHQAEAVGHHAVRLQRRAGPGTAIGWCHPAWRQPVQADRLSRL